MTGGSPKSSHLIINPSDRVPRVKGHEKGASWGGEEPLSLRQQRANSFTQQLKTVMERCEMMSPGDKFLPNVDRDGKILGDTDYSIPSPPERDLSHLDHYSKYNETRLSQLSIDGGYDGSQTSLTRAELEQYTRAYEDVRPPSHSQQPSYAQSEGYHSYVSSADSTTTTPFLDRLRRDNIETSGGGGGGRDSSASSGSSSETLKWHGSLSDVSMAGHTQHIAHSARVPAPQRHHSESVLFLDPCSTASNQNNINTQMRRLFPVTTYEPTSPRQLIEPYSSSSSSRSQPKLSVAERVCEIERQSSQSRQMPPTDHDKPSSRIQDHATLKAMQKKALLSFYERHHSAWKSEPQLTTPSIPPQPPPRNHVPVPIPTSRRSSSASDYAAAVKREIPRSHLDLSKVESNGMRESKHQHSSSCGSLSTAALGPMIVGPAISIDDWVPARPPKKPHLRGAAYQPQPPPRAASPDLPPPSPPPLPQLEELAYLDEPLPPPPPEEFLHPNHSSHPSRQDKARFERAMNASMSLDNLTRSDSKQPSLFLVKTQEPPSRLDAFYENDTELKRFNSQDHSMKNGFLKFNERYVENRIEAMQSSYSDPASDVWDKKPSYTDIRRFSSDKKLPLEPPLRSPHNIVSPPLPNKGKRPHISEQPRSLDSNLSIVKNNNEINKPGPQTPIGKKYHSKDASYKRNNFVRSTSVPSDHFMKNSSERQSLRFTTSSQKLHVDGKIANAVQNGKISPTARKANLVRTPSDVTRRVSYSHGVHQLEPLGKTNVDSIKQHCTEILAKSSPEPKTPDSPVKPSGDLLFKPLPALPPHCPPTTLQLSQSKASYLSYRREPKEKEKGLPNFQGSYKRTMSPNGARITDSSPCIGDVTKSSDADLKKLVAGDDERPPSSDEIAPASQESGCDRHTAREALSKTLPRNYSLSTAAAATAVETTTSPSTVPPVTTKRTTRPPRAQSDPTSSAKVEKKTVAVSASTQDNLDEERQPEDSGKVVLVGRSQSDRTGDARKTDAASQTTPNPSPPPLATPRQPLQEEIECDQLSRDLASQLSPSHKLHGILVPGPDVKKTTDYVSGLFRMDFMPRSRNSISTLVAPTTNDKECDPLPSSGPYPCGDVCPRLPIIDRPPISPAPSMSSLQQKKAGGQELMLRLSKKLNVLRSESVAVNEEIAVNEALGDVVSERVEKVARPQEVAKFRLHVKEVGHITSLLLSLSGRLARAENALLTLNANHQDRKSYEEKRDKLLCQLNEAKQLKANIDQRSSMVSSMLYDYLTSEEYTDYDHFIHMKSKLLVDSREITEKIQLGEEQLSALKETLDQVR